MTLRTLVLLRILEFKIIHIIKILTFLMLQKLGLLNLLIYYLNNVRQVYFYFGKGQLKKVVVA